MYVQCVHVYDREHVAMEIIAVDFHFSLLVEIFKNNNRNFTERETEIDKTPADLMENSSDTDAFILRTFSTEDQ